MNITDLNANLISNIINDIIHTRSMAIQYSSQKPPYTIAFMPKLSYHFILNKYQAILNNQFPNIRNKDDFASEFGRITIPMSTSRDDEVTINGVIGNAYRLLQVISDAIGLKLTVANVDPDLGFDNIAKDAFTNSDGVLDPSYSIYLGKVNPTISADDSNVIIEDSSTNNQRTSTPISNVHLTPEFVEPPVMIKGKPFDVTKLRVITTPMKSYTYESGGISSRTLELSDIRIRSNINDYDLRSVIINGLSVGSVSKDDMLGLETSIHHYVHGYFTMPDFGRFLRSGNVPSFHDDKDREKFIKEKYQEEEVIFLTKFLARWKAYSNASEVSVINEVESLISTLIVRLNMCTSSGTQLVDFIQVNKNYEFKMISDDYTKFELMTFITALKFDRLTALNSLPVSKAQLRAILSILMIALANDVTHIIKPNELFYHTRWVMFPIRQVHGGLQIRFNYRSAAILLSFLAISLN